MRLRPVSGVAQGVGLLSKLKEEYEAKRRFQLALADGAFAFLSIVATGLVVLGLVALAWALR